ncbi:MAG: ribonuclease P protein subunit [Candidatus Woesearchaeota archaeon]|nr:ribonuclease P protein subunit [Candidatus Woesearchaeota archaeon]
MGDALKTELIGREITVESAKNKSLIGIFGKVTDETKNMLFIETPKGEKKIIKSECIIAFEFEGKKATIDGKDIAKKAEERISIKKK